MIMAHFDVLILEKLVQAALLFYRVTDVSFWPNEQSETDLEENISLGI